MLIATTACWGVGTVVTKQVLDDDVAPLTLLTIQLASSCLFVATCVDYRARASTGRLACADSPRSASSTPGSPTHSA